MLHHGYTKPILDRCKGVKKVYKHSKNRMGQGGRLATCQVVHVGTADLSCRLLQVLSLAPAVSVPGG
ncbi:hypothetical protein SKAU_G00410450 [Synaphobranchus kaupii]|uniref:Uncharacterized protein n=1 Tax=Synaphobranchus kaupii TaxID=118154 RepID=A0A9Q1E7P8_SYNKA|nr:hypothetical protein SKAU_G00410450 [Synaphobranchus kaupii]